MNASLAKARSEISKLKSQLQSAESSLKILRQDHDRQIKTNDEMRRVIRSIHQQTKI